MSGSTRYRIYNVSAADLLDYSIKLKKQEKYVFEYNLFDTDSEILVENSPIILKNQNALFYQIMDCLSLDKSNEDCLLEQIINVDFYDNENRQSVFKRSAKNKAILKQIFDGAEDDHKRGILINFKNDKNVRFVPFDKSNSMSKLSRMLFIREELKDKVDERLLLSLPFDRVPFCQSKFFSYRGLYLSDSKRIENTLVLYEKDGDSIEKEVIKEMPLNEKTVIVIDDDNKKIDNSKKDPNLTAGIFTNKTPKQDELFDFITQEEYEGNINAFDGEGIISPDYSEYLNLYLKTTTGATSFQIRMPFTKGVLHEVDFVKFFKEELKLGNPKVKDIFGIERDLNEAKIILTRSMFKCDKLFDRLDKNAFKKEYDLLFPDDKNIDYMKFYFSKFQEFDHALYICQLDTSLYSYGKVYLNYQFLSTLNMEKEDFDRLINQHNYYVDNIEDSFTKGIVIENKDNQNDNEEEEQLDDADEEIDGDYLWRAAIKENPDFLRLNFIKNQIKAKKDSEIKNIAKGNILVNGEKRYLSSDLLAFLLHIYIDCCTEHNNKIFKSIQKECLRGDNCYLPKHKYANRIKENYYYYGILRNPHLSKNEQGLVRIYSGNRYYDDYFGHLRGVVMLPRQSMLPSIMSGADFDGDTVKIIYNNEVVKAIRKGGVYEEEIVNFNNKKIKEYKRKLPAIIINNPDPGTTQENKYISYETINNTFSNSIGKVSNLAFKFSQIDKTRIGEKELKELENKAAECTIVTGIDIDASKHGIHPNKNIMKLEEDFNNYRKEVSSSIRLDRYLEFKEILKSSKNKDPKSLDIETLYLNRLKKESTLEDIRSDSSNAARLLCAYKDAVDKGNVSKKGDRSEYILFNFEQKSDWQNEIANKDNEIFDKVKMIMDCFAYYTNLYRNRQRFLKDSSEKANTALSFIIREFKKAFGSVNKPINAIGTDITDAVYKTIKYLKYYFVSTDVNDEHALDTITNDQASIANLYEKLEIELEEDIKREKENGSEEDRSAELEIVKQLLYLESYKDKDNFSIMNIFTNFLIFLKKSGAVWRDDKDEEHLPNNKYLNEFKIIYDQSIKDGDTVNDFNEKLYSKCKSLLNNVFAEKQEEMIKYVYCLCSIYRNKINYERFMFYAIPANLFLNNIYKKEKVIHA